MALLVLRLTFLIVAVGLSVSIINSGLIPPDSEWLSYVVVGGMLLLAAVVIALDVALPRKPLGVISAVYFGLIVGLFLAYVLQLAFEPLEMKPAARSALNLVLVAVLCYVCISVLLQTRDDFRFIIPYVEFSRELKGTKPCILDTSVLIDGRVADLVGTNLFDCRLVVPKFVIAELQGIADSSDRLRRARGRRGLDVLDRLRNNPSVDVEIFDRELPEFAGQPNDLKLVALARHLHGKLVTNDFNLNKVARLHDVPVVNLNELGNALKPIFLPGEQIDVRLVKPGEEPGQGVGYLEDGTMVVVESGREHVGRTVAVTVTSVLQTSAGRMVFGRCEGAKAAENPR
jgi:uncharacterized protein YacL